jgi:hypothetical protein
MKHTPVTKGYNALNETRPPAQPIAQAPLQPCELNLLPDEGCSISIPGAQEDKFLTWPESEQYYFLTWVTNVYEEHG